MATKDMAMQGLVLLKYSCLSTREVTIDVLDAYEHAKTDFTMQNEKGVVTQMSEILALFHIRSGGAAWTTGWPFTNKDLPSLHLNNDSKYWFPHLNWIICLVVISFMYILHPV